MSDSLPPTLNDQRVSASFLPPIIWLNGPRAVGKSTIGRLLFTRLHRTIAKSAYLDLAQIAFCHPTPAADPHHHRLKATTLATLWQNFHAAGAHHLVVTGTIATPSDLAPYREALHPARVTLIRLDASPTALSARLAARAAGTGAAIPGDSLRDCTPSELAHATEQAVQESAALQTSVIDDLTLDTSTLSPAEAADALLRLLRAQPH